MFSQLKEVWTYLTLVKARVTGLSSKLPTSVKGESEQPSQTRLFLNQVHKTEGACLHGGNRTLELLEAKLIKSEN